MRGGLCEVINRTGYNAVQLGWPAPGLLDRMLLEKRKSAWGFHADEGPIYLKAHLHGWPVSHH